MKLKLRTREALKGLLFVSPWIIGFLIFTLIPLIRTFFYSLNEVKVTAEGVRTFFIGLKNFKDALLSDVDYPQMLIDYFLQMIVFVPIIVSFAMIMSLLLNIELKGRSLFRTIYFLPVVIASGPVFEKLMSKGAMTFSGLANLGFVKMLQTNLPPVFSRVLAMFISGFIMILWYSGVQILVYLAGLQKIDKSMYEAAKIDGASRWQILWKITMPVLAPLTFVNTVYTIVTLSTFATSPIIKKILVDMYRPERGLGYASALAWIYFLSILAVIGIFSLISAIYRRKVKVV
ncbi:sugar ABC transporter permease [Fervidobacterium changbaicum]|uniref:Sugar ABC transporter permease n=2 Tax=Fervidobacterium changbaicum TaxID=310769 RepID=A0ABX5QQ83_9BACT|nr:sugar ABC transporter permease [Fervidobacterium changbaicum]